MACRDWASFNALEDLLAAREEILGIYASFSAVARQIMSSEGKLGV